MYLYQITYKTPESPRGREDLEDSLQDIGAEQVQGALWFALSELNTPKALYEKLHSRLLPSDHLVIRPVDPKSIPCNEIAPDEVYQAMLSYLR
jgi:hypothetical protein